MSYMPAGRSWRICGTKIPTRRRGAYADTSDGSEPRCSAGLRAGDVVMVKGSLGSRMGPLVEAMKARVPGRGGTRHGEE